MRTEEDVNQTVTQYADMVQRICMCHLKNQADMEDIFQTVFIKYMMYDGLFSTEEYRKAWLIRVSINACKDYMRTHFWRRSEPLESVSGLSGPGNEAHTEVLEAVHRLPDRYKDPIYLFYFEGYSAAEVALLIGKSENTVYSLLSRGRSKLKTILGGEFDE